MVRPARTLLAAIALATCLPASARGVGDFGHDARSSAGTLSLDGSWQFALAATPADAEALAGFYRPGADLSRFSPIAVPSNWAVQGFEEPHYKSFADVASEGFYLRRFTVPADWTDKRILLHFGGVWSSAEVWVNGQAIGRVDSGFTTISFDVGPSLRPGGDNVVAVRVRQAQPGQLFDANDDWSLGGIYRSVTLEAMPRTRWIDRVEVQTDFDDQYRDADLKVRVMVGSYGKRVVRANPDPRAERSYALRLTLAGDDGKAVRSQEIPISPHPETGRETMATLRVERPRHWTAETPSLYRLSVELVEAGKVAHARIVAVGFREMSTAGGVFRINGQAVKLRGVNRHDEHPDTGRATTPEQWLQDIAMMKAANINYIRLAHYPPAEGFLDLCDRLGMYVSDEIPMGVAGDTLDDPALAGPALLRSYETVARDINHPSVVIWSVGNEDPLTSLHLAALRTVKGLDPTRPVLMPWRAESWLPPEIDILAPHYLGAESYDALASKADRPVVTTEFTHAFGNDGFGGLESNWKALTRHPAGAGGAIWMWADQGLAVASRKAGGSTDRTLRVVADGFDGIVDSYRRPTRDYWEAQAVYAPVYPASEAIDVTAGQPVVRVPIQNDYDFTGLSALHVQWALMEDGTQLAGGRAPLTGPPHGRSWLDVPLDGLKSWRPGSTYYLAMVFERGDGSVITRRSLELRSANAAVAPALAIGVPAVEQSADRVSVRVGQARYDFNPRSGQLVTAAFAGKPFVLGLRPTIWRPLNETERGVLKRENQAPDLPDLNRSTVSVREWRVTPAGDSARIHAVVDHVVDAANRFTVTYDYTIGATGEIDVRYAVAPQVQAKWLPHVGLELQAAPGMDRLRWLGLGPYDAFPNKRAAPALGLWSATLGSDAGNKATRWAELTDASGKGVHIANDGYVGFDAAAADRVRILSSVMGLPAKNRGPDNPADRLDAAPGRTFLGRFQLRPKE